MCGFMMMMFILYQMWSLEFVEVPDDTQQPKPKEDTPDGPLDKPSGAQAIMAAARRASLSLAQQPASQLPDPMEENSDEEFSGPKEVELGSSADSNGPLDIEEHLPVRNKPRAPKMADIMNEPDLISFDDSPVEPVTDIPAPIPPPRPSRPPQINKQAEKPAAPTPASPNGDFVMVSDSDVKDALKIATESMQRMGPRKRRGLRDGFKWQRQLVFRSKLTMHTAFERKDNKDPAAVTALAVSK